MHDMDVQIIFYVEKYIHPGASAPARFCNCMYHMHLQKTQGVTYKTCLNFKIALTHDSTDGLWAG